jgi:hypothetical protein
MPSPPVAGCSHPLTLLLFMTSTDMRAFIKPGLRDLTAKSDVDTFSHVRENLWGRRVQQGLATARMLISVQARSEGKKDARTIRYHTQRFQQLSEFENMNYCPEAAISYPYRRRDNGTL